MIGATARPAGARDRVNVRAGDGLVLTGRLIEEFLDYLRDRGRTETTLDSYRLNLNQFYKYLPEDKCIRRDTVDRWQEYLLEMGYAKRTVNAHISAVCSLLEYCGRREFKAKKPLDVDGAVTPELTRNEYLRLLSTARALGKERTYFVIKVIASMGLNLQELSGVTAEALETGVIVLGGAGRYIPECLRSELLDYAKRMGILSGPVFLTGNGTGLNRRQVWLEIQNVAHDARVAEEKANPRCLRKLYQATQAGIRENLALLTEQAYNRMLEKEQLTIGWEEAAG